MLDKTFKLCSLSLLLGAQLGLYGCGSSNSDDNNAPSAEAPVALATAIAPDYSGSQILSIEVDNNYALKEGLFPEEGSDYAITSYGNQFYRIGRYNIDNITKGTITNFSEPLWQYSVQGDDTQSSNPYQLVFVNENKAFLLRYGSSTLWVVNPNATTEAEFKLAEIDLSHYDADGVPDMHAAVLVGNKLFVSMQRLAFYSPVITGAIAVIDVDSYAEIDTQQSASFKGIELNIYNPIDLDYNTALNQLIISAPGDYGCSWCDPATPAVYNGGIATLDVDSYQQNLLIDDGDADNHPYRQISSIAIVDATTGYFESYDKDTFLSSLYQFNPTTGEAQLLNNWQDVSMKVLEVDPDQNLWLGYGTNTTLGFDVIETTNHTLKQRVDTALLPSSVTFIW